MSLNKTLDRLFAEIRREAKRNPDFADRLDAVLRLHESRRDVANAVMEEVTVPPASSRPKSAGKMPAVRAPLNPVAMLKQEGEAGLAAALVGVDMPALRALVAEHNLDPSGETAEFDSANLAAHVVAQAKRRAERDEKLFDY